MPGHLAHIDAEFRWQKVCSLLLTTVTPHGRQRIISLENPRCFRARQAGAQDPWKSPLTPGTSAPTLCPAVITPSQSLREHWRLPCRRKAPEKTPPVGDNRKARPSLTTQPRAHQPASTAPLASTRSQNLPSASSSPPGK